LKLTNPRVYLDITIGGVAAGRIVIELRADIVPSKNNILIIITIKIYIYI